MINFATLNRVPVLWRSKDEMQFGIHPTQSIRMAPQTAHNLLQENLERIESTVTPDLSMIPSPEHLTALHREGFTSYEIKNILETKITIFGAGRMGMTIAVLLAGSGYPAIHIQDATRVKPDDVTTWGASRIDIGARRDNVAYLLIERMYRGTFASIPRRNLSATKHLAILCPDPVADWPWFPPQMTDQFIASDQPHIAVACGPQNIHISSVIHPGRTACMKCHDAHLVDADSSWPLISSQLIGRPMNDQTPNTLLLFSAHFVLQLVHAWTNSTNVTESRLWDVQWPSLNTVHTTMTPHPACGCGWNQRF